MQNEGVTVPVPTVCSLCQGSFESKTKLFKHLEADHGIVDNTRKKPVRIAVTVGWISDESVDIEDITDSTARYDVEHESASTKRRVESTLFNTIQKVFGSLVLSQQQDVSSDANVLPKSYSRGSHDRATAPNALERTAHGLSDLFVFVLECHPGPEDVWLAKLNGALPHWIQCFMCKIFPGSGGGDFSANQSCNQRRYEYILPLKSVLPSTDEEYAMVPSYLIESKEYNENPKWKQRVHQSVLKEDFDTTSKEGMDRVKFFRVLKAIMKKFHGRYLLFHNFLSGGACPDDSSALRVVDRLYHKDSLKGSVTDTEGSETWIVFSVSGDNFIRGQIRRMLGLSIALARGWLPIKYFDFAVYKAPYKSEVEAAKKKSAAGAASSDGDDNQRQKKRIKIDVPKEKHLEQLHPDLLGPKEVQEGFEFICDLPSLPGTALYIAECKYPMFEAKHVDKKFFLDPRRIPKGARTKTDDENIERMEAFTTKMHNHIMSTKEMRDVLKQTWATEMQANCARMVANAERAMELKCRTTEDLVSIQKDRIDIPKDLPDHVRAQYAKVLTLLREADNSGKWPQTSVGRKQVMVNSGLVEFGGRGGTFSVGAFPANQAQPKGNELFPELAKACFDLEKIIQPERKPSTTIAINRHAQFKFHRDSGAGSGQTKSSIVALGDFSGGELQCEYEVEDIRYKPYEFDGWGQRHSTLPFVGERYSLVWFTPLGLD
jgi:tRNA pseudouridine(38-40) synthase